MTSDLPLTRRIGRRSRTPGRSSLLAAACLLAGVAAFAVPWYFLLTSRMLFGDWTYFNSLSLVIRSSVLHYGVFPTHDPWVGGGTDILANPQSRVFSPLVLLDYLLPPPMANLGSLTAYAVLGVWGGYRLLRFLGASRAIALSGAIVFINASWFGLHYAEGHIPYGGFQMLPWALFFTLTIQRLRSIFGLLSLQTLLLLDGGIYAWVFTIFLVGSCLAVGLGNPWQHVTRPSLSRLCFVALALTACMLLAACKAVPVLSQFVTRTPSIDFASIPLEWLARFFFHPLQSPVLPAIATYRFHEFGCYLSGMALLILAVALATTGLARRQLGFLVLVLFWFWVGSGWGGAFNPWHLFQRIPVLNNVHVQSRVFILMYLFLVVAVFLGLEGLTRRWEWKRAHLVLCALLVGESLVVHNYPFVGYAGRDVQKLDLRLITATIISATQREGQKPSQYFTGTGSVVTYEPFPPPTSVRASDDPEYRGEAYVIRGQGVVRLWTFTPGSIAIAARASTPMLIGLNTNWLAGWRVIGGTATARRGDGGLVELELPSGNARVHLKYSPDYWPVITGAFLGGLILWSVLLARIRRRHAPRRSATFDYSRIPLGYYDDVVKRGKAVRRTWHLLKFERVLDLLPAGGGQSLLDVGCFSGTFLGMVPESSFATQLGVDILPAQIDYAQAHYGTSFRKFQVIALDGPGQGLACVSGQFDCVTLIEVIEHLRPEEIRSLLEGIASRLKPGGTIVFSTPNYSSAWPLIEILVNKISDISYEEQHITRFNYFTVASKLRRIDPTFDRRFSIEVKTTSHFVAPFIAPLVGVERARSMSRRLPHRTWKFPFGSLLIVALRRRPEPPTGQRPRS